MRRVRYYRYGGPEVLTIEETARPEPGPGQVRLRAEAVGANFVDTKIRGNAGGIFYRPLPGSLTGDVVGTIDAIGPGVDPGRFRAGERVAALVDPDAFADYALADCEWLAPVPAGMTAGPASLLPTAGPVALRIVRTGQVAAGETVLIHSGAGTIGGLAIQLAKLLGAGTVIATAGTAEKRRHTVDLGADVAIDYTAEDWPEQVRAVAPGGVDVALDAVGGATLQHSLDLLAPMGRAVTYGAAGGEMATLPVRSFFRNRTLSGFSLLAWRAARPGPARAEMTEVAGYLADGRLRSGVRATLPLTEAVKAHELLADRGTIGRILLTP